MTISKRVLSVILSAVLIFASVSVYAAGESGEAVSSSNIHSNNYSNGYPYWASTVNSYLYLDDEENFVRVEYTDNVTIEVYDSSYELVSSQEIEAPLSLFGGFYHGEEYNYFVFGQSNLEESDEQEIMRIQKYSYDWVLLGEESVYGANTYIPFDAGSLRFAEYGGLLYIHTCHEMYTSDDGKNHQANMTYILDENTMDMVFSRYNMMNIYQTGYVSHSFNQFIAADEDTNSIVTLDHGDAYPRSLAIVRYNNRLGSSTLSNISVLEIFDIYGETGDNYTGVSVGGFEVSENNYITAFNSELQSADSTSIKNVYVNVTSKSDFTESGSENIQLTDYDYDGSVTPGTPALVDIGNGQYLVMWEVMNYSFWLTYTNSVSYVIIDENGNMLTDIYTSEGSLSDCQPIVSGNSVVWYVTDGTAPVFMSIDLDEPENITIEKCPHKFAQSSYTAATCTEEGEIVYECSICGYTYSETVEPNGHRDRNSDYICDVCGVFLGSQNDDETTSSSGEAASSSSGETTASSSSVTVSWDKSVYTKADESATVTISSDSGVYLDDFSVSARFYSCEYSVNFVKFYIAEYDPGTYTVVLILTNGQVLDTYFTITDGETEESTTAQDEAATAEEENTTADEETTFVLIDTGTTTEPSVTTPSTNLSTDISADPSTNLSTDTQTDPTTEPSTNLSTDISADPSTSVSDDGDYIMGDLNDDGRVSASDARIALRISAKLETATDAQLIAGDVNGDGKLSASDARMILRFAAQLIASFDAE
ncbi:MAG: dockerin type I domain-containing protein [Clostridiales bacterium]|nr:dockerin type I domain-containing protein [Clostridiales bacterium]